MAVVRPAIAVTPLPVGVLVPGQLRNQITYDDIVVPRPAERTGEWIYTWIDDTTVDWDLSLFPKRHTASRLLRSLALARAMGIRIFHELQETTDRTAYLATLTPLETLVAKNMIRYEDELRRVREITGDPQYQLSPKFLPLLAKLKPTAFWLYSDIIKELEDRGRAVAGPKLLKIRPVDLYDMMHELVPTPPTESGGAGAAAAGAAEEGEEPEYLEPVPFDPRPDIPRPSARGRVRRKQGMPEVYSSSSSSRSSTAEEEDDDPLLHRKKKARTRGKMPLK